MRPDNKTVTMEEYPVPISIDAEYQILSDIIGGGDPELMYKATEVLTEESFANDSTRRVWTVIKEMHDAGEPVELTTVLGRIDGATYGRIIGYSAEYGHTAEAHLRALESLALRRRAYMFAFNIVQRASGEMAVDYLSEAPRQFSDIVDGTQRSKGPRKIGDVINSFADEIQEREAARKEGKTGRIPTSFTALDSNTGGGFGPGQLIILAARPSVGKTSVMLQMARAAASVCPTEVFSLEMTEYELVEKIFRSTGEITTEHLDRSMDWEAFNRVTAWCERMGLYLNTRARSLGDICSRIRADSHRGICKVAFIDYLGLINDGMPNTMPKAQRIGTVTRTLKELAQTCGIPIVLLCQLNRGSAEGNRPPQLYDLRDSGDIEQDADIVIMLQHLDEQEDRDNREPGENGEILRLWVRKNRHGRRDWRLYCTIGRNYNYFEQKGYC